MIRPSGLDLGIVSSRKLESMSRCLVLLFSLSCLVQRTRHLPVGGSIIYSSTLFPTSYTLRDKGQREKSSLRSYGWNLI